MRRKQPTSQDVARLAGVSQSTVSYVLTGSRPISAATRARVEDAIEKLGYHPNSGARSLRSRRSGVIGLMIPQARVGRSEAVTFIEAISHEARRHGYDILLVTAQEGAAGIHRVVRTGVCEALILMELDRRDERVAAVLDSGLPVVLIGIPEQLDGICAVDLDFERLGRMVVDRALGEGCARLFLFGGMTARLHRNEVSRFLDGVQAQVEESAAREPGRRLEIVHDAAPIPEVLDRARALTPAGSRTAVFGLGHAPELLFSAAASGALTDPALSLIALTGEELAEVSPLLADVPRIDPRRVEVSEIAVRELVRLLRTPGATPRVQLVEPAWAAPPSADAAPDGAGAPAASAVQPALPAPSGTEVP
ncbi:LacI family transcriptional regulator [Brachybacterium phenoliresistens]|uniref:LacI family transcriptional regulator n=1 Tax=Brachybacterium phenoliresistens TaxID=396014 RepID=Z9JPT1_9MICO|nr:LacI family DNA-binding transcriptional regulator [Brachybacterium phenoliresistens]EWS79806.1 LacI family transcriptional regulator [Brachybacterium phenoliresistens]